MAGIVTNGTAFCAGLDREVSGLNLRFRIRVRKLLDEGMARMLRRTPVNTGQAVMNYVASAGTAYSGVKVTGDPVEPTNHLALGAEQLRAEHEAVSMATLASVDLSNPFQTFWIANNSPDIGGLEHGELPEAPYTPRSPGGMFRVTVEELTTLLQSGKI